MPRTKGDFLESTPVLAQRDLAFGAAVEVIENRLREPATGKRPEVFHANHSWRRHRAFFPGHLGDILRESTAGEVSTSDLENNQPRTQVRGLSGMKTNLPGKGMARARSTQHEKNRSVCCHPRRLLLKLTTQLLFQRSQLRFNILSRFPLLDDLLAITAQEIIDRLHTDAD